MNYAGEMTKDERREYYRAVLKYLCKRNDIRYTYEDLTIQEYKLYIDEILENYENN